MKLKSPLIVAILLSFNFCIYSQIPEPTPPGVEKDDVVRISTSLIQIDASITDKKGEPITDIRPDEIEVFENGVKQDVVGFSFVSNAEGENDKENSDRTRNVLLPVTPLRPDQVRRTIALVVDDLGLSFESTSHVRHALRKFVNEQMRDGDLVAIIRTGGGMGALQQFTSDKRILLRAVDKVKFNLNGRGLTGAFAPIRPPLSADEAGPAEGAATSQEMQKENEEYRQTLFSVGTLGALNYIAKGMGQLPGRKSVVLFTEGFNMMSGSFVNSRVVDSLRQLADLSNRASVVFYTVDPRGLVVPGLLAEDNTYLMTGDEVGAQLEERQNTLFSTQQSLRFLAEQTGGFSIINQNDIVGGVRKILRDQSYYLIAYVPADETFDPAKRRFNNLEVRVKRDGAQIRYRSGFFGISDEKIGDIRTQQQTGLIDAITSPFAANGIDVKLNTLFARRSSKENFVRSYLHIDAEDLTFVKADDGGYTTKFDLVALNFGDNGQLFDDLANTHTITFSAEGYEKVKKKGVIYSFNFPIKKPGAYQMRVAVRDVQSNKVGSASQFIDVPNLKKDRLMLSGIMLESMDYASFQTIVSDPSLYASVKKETDPANDTVLREFKPGSVIRCGFEVYNAKNAQSGAKLTTQLRIYRGEQLIHESSERPLDAAAADRKSNTIPSTVSFRLGNEMELGEYILQVIVRDGAAKSKYAVASQFLTFDVVQ